MVDTQLLERFIEKSGKTKSHLARQMGCTIQSFRLKATNKSDFRLSEVEVLCDELRITRLTDKERIFFKRSVDNSSTRKDEDAENKTGQAES